MLDIRLPLQAALILVVAILGKDLDATEPAFAWDLGESHVALTDSRGTIIWQFNTPPAPANPYFHPVALPGHGPLTWHSPPDHPWHLGLWFSWKFVNGLNYWETDARAGRSEGLTLVLKAQPLTRPDFSARIQLELAYQAAADAAPVLRELRVIEISAPGADGSYWLDWKMTFTAGTEPVRLDRTPLPNEPDGRPWGGYAGLIWRFAQEFSDWRAVNSQGLTGEQTHGAPAAACEFSGLLDGVAMGVAMLDHSENLNSPSPWYVSLDRTTPFACLMPAPLFEGVHTLHSGETLTLRYRTLVHPGRWNPERLRKEFEEYAAGAAQEP